MVVEPIQELVVNVTSIEPVANITTTESIVNNTINEPIVEQPTDPTGEQHTSTFGENMVLSDDSLTQLEQDTIIILSHNNQTITIDETFILNDNATLIYNNNTVVEIIPNNLNITLNEILTLNGTATSSGIPLNHTATLPESFSFTDDLLIKLNNTSQNNLFDGITFADDVSILLNNQTIQPDIEEEPEDLFSNLFTNGILSDLINLNYTNRGSFVTSTFEPLIIQCNLKSTLCSTRDSGISLYDLTSV